MELLKGMAVALGIGLLIGLERGWHGREAGEGQRVAGIRTFGLVSLLGAISAVLAEAFDAMVLGFAFAGFAALMVMAQSLRAGPQRDFGITTTVAALLTFLLGAAATAGYADASVAVAVVTALLLGLKPELHGFVSHLEKQELLATFKLLLISVVMLPVLPDRGFGPWQALNPYRIWWLVVLIAGIGFAGYFAMKLAGPRRGAVLTGLFGGLASSTAVALNFARLGRHNVRARAVLAAGIVTAAGAMFPRILIEVTAVNPALLGRVIPAVAAMMLTAGASAAWLWQRGRSDLPEPAAITLPNPFELMPAVRFTALLAAILLAAKAAVEWLGASGVYLIALVSGLANVDAITVSLADLARHGLEPSTAARGIVIAAIMNTLVKGFIAVLIGGSAMGRPVAMAVFAIVFAGLAALIGQSL